MLRISPGITGKPARYALSAALRPGELGAAARQQYTLLRKRGLSAHTLPVVKFLRFLAGLLMVPCGAVATRALFSMVQANHLSVHGAVPPGSLALASGFLLWIAVYFLLPRPVRSYVIAHELTHALWGMAMGARVSGLKITDRSGSVTVSKNNAFITLAPYFFPLYTVLVIAGYYGLGVFYEVERYFDWWMGLIGFTWAFHFTFTVGALMQRQSDIREYGRLFSYAMIYLFNVLGVVLWTVLVSPVTLEETAGYFEKHTLSLVEASRGLIRNISQ
ncbi:MAG: hypothetical protein R6V03_09610 [Kiritimatiellia bacterium]